MIQGIIDDAKAMEADAIKAEEEAYQAYEDFVKDSEASVEAKNKEIIMKQDMKAKEEQAKVMEEGNEAAAEEQIEQLKKEQLDLHMNCDYLLKNFETRLVARDEEVQALKEGISTFSGATFSSFMQAW